MKNWNNMKLWKAVLIIYVSLVIIALNFIICNAAEAGDRYEGRVQTLKNSLLLCYFFHDADKLYEMYRLDDTEAILDLYRTGKCIPPPTGTLLDLYSISYDKWTYKVRIVGTSKTYYGLKWFIDHETITKKLK